MKELKNEIIIFENQEIKLEVNMKEDTVWLTQNQMSQLFNVKQSTIAEHIKNIFREGELDIETSIGNSDKSIGGRKPKIYNLDVIISVGYRVKSNNGVIFRKWANKVLKEYLIKGYSINEKRLDYLEKTVRLIDIASRVDTNEKELKDIIKVINNYSKSLGLLDDYDHQRLEKIKGHTSEDQISYEQCMYIIDSLKTNFDSDIFALERNKGLQSIINNIYQTYSGEDVYKSIEEKIANFFYMIIKNHVFIDGNKRIAATLLIYILFFYDLLYIEDKQVIDNNTLVSLTLLIAESNPKEKESLINLIMNLINNSY